MLTIGGKSNELCKWTTTGRLFRIRIANTLRITTSAKVPVNKLAYKTDNNEGKNMKKITLKYPTRTTPSNEEMDAVLKKYGSEHTELAEWDVLYWYIADIYGESVANDRYFSKKFLKYDNTLNYSIENMDQYILHVKDTLDGEGVVTEEQYKKFKNKEKFFYHFARSMEIKGKINTYFQRLIDITDTPNYYYRCADLANSIGLEREVIFELYKRGTTSFEEKRWKSIVFTLLSPVLMHCRKQNCY